ncbi:MAG: tetratricopeptide repeat protein, partial [Acidobacteria bacterium]|nr:tetratricopeptide repeat protein [Acidobacteriota bacterium]
LEESGQMSAAQKRAANFFLALAERAEPELAGAGHAEWAGRLEQEHDNIRAALQWTLEREPETGLRLAGAVWRFWTTRGHYTEGRRWLQAALEKSSRAATPARAKALIGAGGVAWQQGDQVAAWGFYEEGLEAGREMGDKLRIAQASNGLAIVALNQDQPAAARTLLEESLKISRELGNNRLIAIALGNLGEAARLQGDLATARTLYEEGVARARQSGNMDSLTITLANLGAVAYQEKNFRAADSYYREALTLAQELGGQRFISYPLDGFAALAAQRRDWERAAQLAGAAEALREAVGSDLENVDRVFRDQYVAEIRAALDETTFAAVYEQGRTLKTEQAIALALEPPSPDLLRR